MMFFIICFLNRTSSISFTNSFFHRICKRISIHNNSSICISSSTPNCLNQRTFRTKKFSDPREVVLKQRARHLAYDKGFEEEYNMLCSIERLAPGIFAEEKGSTKPVCANVDLFSGLIYNMLGISEDLYTPLFAIARVPGWCAHRVEEVVFANRIIRPAYKYLGVRQKYKPIEER